MERFHPRRVILSGSHARGEAQPDSDLDSFVERETQAWPAKAENDLLNVENNLAAAHVPWDTISFHAQQAAEKLLKAFVVYRVLSARLCIGWCPPGS